MKRKASITRKTKETKIDVELNIDGKGQYKIDTGIGFLDHMLEQLSKHSSIDLKVKAKGDTHIDLHHTTEDTGIAIGECLKKASKKFIGIKRYAHAMIPMDETLTRVALDVSNRPYLIWKVDLKVEKLGEMDTELFMNFLKHLQMKLNAICILKTYMEKTTTTLSSLALRPLQEVLEWPLLLTIKLKILFHHLRALYNYSCLQ